MLRPKLGLLFPLLPFLFLIPQCLSHCEWCKQFSDAPPTKNGTFQVIVGQNASMNPATKCKEITVTCKGTYVSETRILSVYPLDGGKPIVCGHNHNSGESLKMVATCSHFAYWEFNGVPISDKVSCEEGPPVKSTTPPAPSSTTDAPGCNEPSPSTNPSPPTTEKTTKYPGSGIVHCTCTDGSHWTKPGTPLTPSPGGGDGGSCGNGGSTPSGGNTDDPGNGPTTPSGGNNGPSTPDGGNGSPSTPDGGNGSPSTPDGGNNGPTTPSGGNGSPSTPNEGNNGQTTPNGGTGDPGNGSGTTPSGGNTGNPSTPNGSGSTPAATPPPGSCFCPCSSPSSLSSLMTTASPSNPPPSTASTPAPSTAAPSTAAPSTPAPSTAAPSTAAPTPSPTTTRGTTTVACPAGGEWSAFTAGPCSATCGNCGTQTLTRTCTSAARGCPCTGAPTQTRACGDPPCIFPAQSCCTPFRAKASAGKIVCG